MHSLIRRYSHYRTSVASSQDRDKTQSGLTPLIGPRSARSCVRTGNKKQPAKMCDHAPMRLIYHVPQSPRDRNSAKGKRAVAAIKLFFYESWPRVPLGLGGTTAALI
ncbi:unnamed protein product [Protopolystoma xenopodis]|uniref:Uncharacterized protein n=1 Tax=Protopolystoma xenopodis TaxID=117903 RepID=A0A3S5FGU8_9PLAT|nr:unnamed protein product [Protopolystoma xenopodis]